MADLVLDAVGELGLLLLLLLIWEELLKLP
jgi:hypothetical protein